MLLFFHISQKILLNFTIIIYANIKNVCKINMLFAFEKQVKELFYYKYTLTIRITINLQK